MTPQSALYTGRLGAFTLRRTSCIIRVGIQDARVVCGRLRFLVTPIAGSGAMWVNAESVRLDDTEGLRVAP